MAQNLHGLPPSKRFKLLNSEQISPPPNAPNENNPKSLPAKKRAEILNSCSTAPCLPAKKRVWAPHPLSPTKTETKAQDTDPLAKGKGQIKGREASHGVPVKKRVWVQHPLSPTKTETQAQETDPKHAEEKGENPVPVKKRVWAKHPLSPTKPGTQGEVTNLNSVLEKNQIHDFEEVKEIHRIPAKKRFWDPNPLSPTKTETQEGMHLKLAKEKDQNEYQIKEVKEISVAPAKRWVWALEPLTPTKTQTEEDIDPKPFKDKAQNEFQNPLSPIKTQTQDEEEIQIEEEEEIDDGVVCAVCQSTDGDPSDPIVFCDGCDLMVHASCYGNPLIKSIPEGDWFCLACSSSKTPKKEKKCCLCPVKGGALKPTVDDKWAHVMCALLVPEVFFRDPEGREGIDCSRVPQKRWQKKDCFICGRNYGCAIDCAESKCKLGFHVTCGLEEGLCIEYKEGKGGDIVAGFCAEHTKIWEKQQLTGKFKIVSRDQELRRKTV